MFKVNSACELIRALRNMDITVPGRTEGRKKEHTERYGIAHLLSTLAQSNVITYPIDLVHRERPDFLLSMGSNRIGVEHTEAVSENEAHKMALRERGHGPDICFIGPVRPGEGRKKGKKLIDEIELNDAGLGWTDDQANREWANAMFYSVEKKCADLRKDGFDRFDQDWLLVYDNTSLPGDVRAAAPKLLNCVQKSQAIEEFRRIFIMTDGIICELSRSGIMFHTTNDLWN